MGDIIGGVIGGIGSLVGGSEQSNGEQYAADRAAETARLGFDYLTASPIATQYLPTGGAANSQIAALLGVGGDPAAANNAFQNYQNSTGTQFQLSEGQKAITTSNAAKGLLNSGATLKALTRFGQNLGSSTFNNYLQQLGGLSTAGLTAGASIGGAGSQAGATGANAISQGYGNAAATTGSMYGNAFGALGDVLKAA